MPFPSIDDVSEEIMEVVKVLALKVVHTLCVFILESHAMYGHTENNRDQKLTHVHHKVASIPD